MLFVLLLLSGGEGGGSGGGGGFNDGVEMEGDGGIAAHLVAEVGEVERGLTLLSTDAGHELAYLHLRLYGVDVDHIVGTGFALFGVGVEDDFYVQAFRTEIFDVHDRQRTTSDKQMGIVDVDFAIVEHEATFVEAREVVGFGQPFVVRLFGKASLEDDAEEGGRSLPRLEEGSLPLLRLRLLVGEF